MFLVLKIHADNFYENNYQTNESCSHTIANTFWWQSLSAISCNSTSQSWNLFSLTFSSLITMGDRCHNDAHKIWCFILKTKIQANHSFLKIEKLFSISSLFSSHDKIHRVTYFALELKQERSGSFNHEFIVDLLFPNHFMENQAVHSKEIRSLDIVFDETESARAFFCPSIETRLINLRDCCTLTLTASSEKKKKRFVFMALELLTWNWGLQWIFNVHLESCENTERIQ
jgi:hypothetical protein